MCQNPISENINAYKKTKKQMCHSANTIHKKTSLPRLLKRVWQQFRNFGTLVNLFLQIKGSQKIKKSFSKTKKKHNR